MSKYLDSNSRFRPLVKYLIYNGASFEYLSFRIIENSKLVGFAKFDTI